MSKKRLNKNELKALAATIGIPEDVWTFWDNLGNPPPSKEEDEFNEYLQFELESEFTPFKDTCSEHKLFDRLGDKGCGLLFDVWSAANCVRFILEGQATLKRPEWHVTHHEKYFLTMRTKLFRSKAWKRLPAATRKDIESRLFTFPVES
jgi:hypothetical protein